MYLKRLEIQGFKTFASHTVLEFRPGITAIVGPNGSGKSNLNDAIRWVLGEQSYAALRSKRTEDLIFGGGSKRAPAGLAQVSLTIDNSDRVIQLPYSEVTITRRATRAGENEYQINRNRVRLKDVLAAIGPLGGSYTIINQGLVDAALTLRPEERRRLFEDAAEIGTFVTRKAEAEQRLRETNANVERCADVLAELEPRLRSLKRQASLARTYRDLTAELRNLLVQHYTESWQAARQALDAAELAHQALATELAARRAAQTATTVELADLRERIQVLRDKLSVMHDQANALNSRAEVVRRDIAVRAERLAALARREEEIEHINREFDLRREEQERERAIIIERIIVAEERLAAARSATMTYEAELATHAAERRAARQQLDLAQRDELGATAALNESYRRSEQLQQQRKQLLQERDSQAKALSEAEAALVTQRSVLATAEAVLAEALQARAEAATVAEQTHTELETMRAEHSRAEEAIAAARRVLTDVETRFETLNRLQRSYAGAFAGVKAAMQWAESQGRSGFVLVATLIRPPAHLETAIEVALGSRLQNIVVEHWQDAEDVIVALKRNGAGRATFLPLDTIRQTLRSERWTPNSDVLGVAADLVDYDDHYHSVVWQLLGRTLVVHDLRVGREELRRLSGGWTIVTLSGEQINSGGAVTGGAQIKETGTLRRERELRELPEQIALHQQELTERTATCANLERRLAIVQQAVREAEGRRRKAAQAYEAQREAEARARREVERAELLLDTQRRRHAQVNIDLAALEDQLLSLDVERAVLEQREQDARAKHAELRAQEQARIEGEQAAQTRRAELRGAVADAEAELRTERALLQAQEQQITRLEQQRSAGVQRIEELLRERAVTEAQMQSLEASQTDLLTQIDEIHALIGPAEAQMVELEKTHIDLEQRERELTAALLEGEMAHSQAIVEVQRGKDRLDAIWERAAADDIDVETLIERHKTEASEQDITSQVGAPQSLASDAQPSVLEKIEQLRDRIRRLGTVNPLALEEYEEESNRCTFMTTQIDDLHGAAQALRELIAELDSAMRTRFASTFEAIAAEFEKGFVRLFGGGEARLTLVGATEAVTNGTGKPHESIDDMGIEITVRPPGKRQQNIALLSGGERTLTAAALLFAILTVNPSPFCVLDEVDAALDEANVGRFRAMLTEMSRQTQFLLVTHNRGTIEAADTIYGVSMGEDGASRVLSLRLEDVESAKQD